MKKPFLILMICIFYYLNVMPAFSAQSASQTVGATLDRGGGSGGATGDGLSGGAIAGIALGGGGGAATGATALAFAPILLAGLSPNSVVSAAAPLNGIVDTKSYLRDAILNHFEVKEYSPVLKNMENKSKLYFAQNDTEIINGSFDLADLPIPKELYSAHQIRINITLTSQPYKAVDGEPELSLNIYKNIAQKDLSKKFETQQFLHHYLMKRYKTPTKIPLKEYDKGLQKLSVEINMAEIKNKQQPLQVVVKYTEDGFQKNQKIINPKTNIYAYIAEFEKIR